MIINYYNPRYLLPRLFNEVVQNGFISACRAAAYIFKSIFRTSKDISIDLFGESFYLLPNKKKLGIGGLIYAHRNRFEHELQNYFSLTSAGVFLDIGANFGYWSRYVFSRELGGGFLGKIYAVEPSPENARVLRRNVECISVPVVVVEAAAGDSNGYVTLNSENEDPGSIHTKKSSRHGIPVVIMDEIVKPEDVVQLVKIDVEGNELSVLKGAVNIIKRDRPRVICEVISRYLERAGESPNSLFTWMESISYRGRLVNVKGDLDVLSGYQGDGNYIFEWVKDQGSQRS